MEKSDSRFKRIRKQSWIVIGLMISILRLVVKTSLFTVCLFRLHSMTTTEGVQSVQYSGLVQYTSFGVTKMK